MEKKQTVSKNKERQQRRYHVNEPVVTTMASKKNAIPSSQEEYDNSDNIIKWGKKNTYRYYLNYLFKNNPIHAGIVRSKRYFTVSGGLGYDGEDVDAWEAFFENGKKTHEEKNLDELMWSTSLNYEKSNMFCFKVKINRLQGNIRKIEEIPFEKVAFGCEKDDDGNVILDGTIKVSDDWTDKNESIQTLFPYDPKDDTQRMFYVIFKEESGQSIDSADAKKINPGFYPDPPYGGAIVPIDTGIQINLFNNNEIYNNFSLGNILQLNNGAPKNEEQREALKDKIRDEAEGAVNAGSTLILLNNGKDKEASLLNLSGSNLPDRYNNTKKGTEESIIHGHSVTSPILFGIKTEGSLGNATELETAYQIMQANYFEGRRNALLSVVNWLANEIAGLTGKAYFNDPKIEFEKLIEDDKNEVADALNRMSPLVQTKVLDKMTPNEIRSLGNLDPLEGGDSLPDAAPEITEEDEETILSRFEEVGRGRGEILSLFSCSLIDGTEAGNEAVIEAFQKSLFNNLSDNQLQTLNLISQGEDFNTIRKALDISGTDLAKIYKSLSSSEMISDTGEILEMGASEVAAADIEKLEVLFEYRLKATAPELVPGGSSRDFCSTLIALNRVYTREEIDFISGQEGYDVFRYRGGWYHNPDTDNNEPGCRHEWAQIVVFKNS